MSACTPPACLFYYRIHYKIILVARIPNSQFLRLRLIGPRAPLRHQPSDLTNLGDSIVTLDPCSCRLPWSAASHNLAAQQEEQLTPTARPCILSFFFFISRLLSWHGTDHSIHLQPDRSATFSILGVLPIANHPFLIHIPLRRRRGSIVTPEHMKHSIPKRKRRKSSLPPQKGNY